MSGEILKAAQQKIKSTVSNNSKNYLRLNVGFIIHQSVGFSREFYFEFPTIHIQPDLDLKDLIGTVRGTRTQQGLLIQVKMTAEVTTECVRCLENFQQPLEINFTELYAFSPNTVTDTDLVLPETAQIDLGPLVREEMLLAIPINPVCRPECQGLCPICGEELSESACNHEDELVDPRLAVLKSLLEKKG